MMKGAYTALVTPFDENLKVDFDGFEELLHYQIEGNIDGVVVLGTTGEAPTLTPEEQEELIKRAVKIVKGKKMLLIGTGSYSTEETLKKTKRAEAFGADAALIITPYYNKPTQEGIYQHFKKINDHVGIPILLYNHQGRTGQNIQTDTLKRMMEFKNIIGVKEASGNTSQMMEVIENAPDNFSVLSGDDLLTFPLIALGGHGVVSIVSNLIPSEIKKLCDLALSGNIEEARKLHYELLPLFRGAFLETNPSPIKFLMNERGLPSGGLRLPLVSVQNETAQKLRELWLPETLTSRN